MKVRETVEELVTYGPRGLVRADLIDFLQFGFDLTPHMDALSDSWCEVGTGDIGHVRDSKNLKE
jgi:hypothetical protein